MAHDTVEGAVTDAPDGCFIAIDAKPGRPRARFPAGYDAWRRRVVAHLDAPARDNKANQALLRAVTGLFDIPADRLRLTEGATHHHKRIHLIGISKAEAVRRLGAALAEAQA